VRILPIPGPTGLTETEPDAVARSLPPIPLDGRAGDRPVRAIGDALRRLRVTVNAVDRRARPPSPAARASGGRCTPAGPPPDRARPTAHDA